MQYLKSKIKPEVLEQERLETEDDLNRFIAMRFIGWHPEPFLTKQKVVQFRWWDEKGCFAGWEVPKYVSDLNAIMGVITSMTDQGLRVVMEYTRTRCTCIITTDDTVNIGCGTTPQLAVIHALFKMYELAI